MAQKKRVQFKKTVREVRPYDLEKSEVRMKRCGCLPPENEDLILHHPDMQKKEWRRVLQELRNQDKTIETNISKIPCYQIREHVPTAPGTNDNSAYPTLETKKRFLWGTLKTL